MITRPGAIQAHASVQFASQNVAFYVGFKDAEGKRRVLQASKEWITQDPAAGVFIEPSFVLHTEATQALFEELWAQGFRSVHDRGGADKLDAARKEHIEDLRKAAKLK